MLVDSEQFDEKTLATLAAILGMVVDDNDGESANALSIIRRRAKASGITGGVIKDTFVKISGLNVSHKVSNLTDGAQDYFLSEIATRDAKILGLECDLAAMETSFEIISAENFRYEKLVETLKVALKLCSRKLIIMTSVLAVTVMLLLFYLAF